MENDNLIDKLQYMSKDDLESFLLTAKITGGGSTFIGITTIILTLMYTSTAMVIVAFFVLYLFGNIAIASDNLKTHIRILLAALAKDK